MNLHIARDSDVLANGKWILFYDFTECDDHPESVSTLLIPDALQNLMKICLTLHVHLSYPRFYP